MKKIVKLILAFPIIFSLLGGNVKAADDLYTIRPGDVLQITVWKEDSLDKEVLVLPDGTVTFPLIGSFSVQGMTPSTAEKVIKKKLEDIIPDASVAVLIKAPLGHSVNVIGQVVKSGEIMMGRNLTVMQALSQAGGLTPYADEDDIIVLRRDKNNKQISIPFPYDDVVSGNKLDKDITLQSGDVVVVPTASLFSW
jgi:polysaccharide biosynthesis/export protein